MKDEIAYVYIVECADGSLYTGWTRDVESRIIAHNTGRGAKYTRGRLPVTLRYVEQLDGKSAALRRECEIKRLPVKKKRELLEKQ